jgi:hypothetical protein
MYFKCTLPAGCGICSIRYQRLMSALPCTKNEYAPEQCWKENMLKCLSKKNKIVDNDSAARIELNPIDQFARTTNRLAYLTDVRCTRPGGPFFHSLSINFSRPRVTSPPPRLKTSRQSFQTPPSRTHTFLPAMRMVALVCVFN